MKIESLGPYRIEKQIGKGGMGAVFQATYQGPGQAEGTRVAVKALSPQLAMDDGFRERFEAEIESLKKLRHDGIVRLYGYGEQDGILFYSMELVEGTSLEQEINSGRRFDWKETLSIGIQICRALKHAHDHGVVHRDIKPANLLLTEDGRIKIADFGIARLFGGTQLTTAGGVLGTADYMSPEQADGRPVTEKCDQYSLGGVMYGLLAGRPPFRAKTMPEMLQMQRFAEPEPVERFAPDTPDQLSRLIGQLLSKNPEARFPNVLVLGRHMEAMQKALSRPPRAMDSSPDQNGKTDVSSESPPKLPNATSAEAKNVTTTGGKQASDSLLDTETVEAADLSDAPTLAQPDSQPSAEPHAPPADSTSPVILQPPGTARFTTLDEEIQRRERQEESDSHLLLAARWAALLLMLGAIGWFGLSLMRPPSADELYKTIATAVDEEDSDLRWIATELEEFLERFPDDPRVAEVTEYWEKLEYHRLARQARSQSRFSGNSELAPIQQLYLEAISKSDDDPFQAEQMLTDLVTLYDPRGAMIEGTTDTLNGVNNLSEDDGRWLVLARQELSKLQEHNREFAASQLPALEKQLRFAAAVAERDPVRGSEMYQAFIRLYGAQPWAKQLVEQAKESLSEFNDSR